MASSLRHLLGELSLAESLLARLAGGLQLGIHFMDALERPP